MNPQALLIDLSELAATLPTKAEKDERRVRLFFAAVLNRGMALAAETTTDVDALKAFATDLGDLGAEFERDAAALGSPRRWSLGLLLGHGDPFAPGRERVRALAAKWALDPVFIEAMG